MTTTVQGLIKSVENEHDYRGDERKVLEIELENGETVKAFDDTEEVEADMQGNQHEMTLMARAARHLGNWDSEFLDNPYYCIVSGEVVERDLQRGEHRAARIDFGQGEMIVSYERDNSHTVKKGEELDVLADKLVLLDLS